MTSAATARGVLKGLAGFALAAILALVLAWLIAATFGGRSGDRAARLPVAVTPALLSRGAYLAEVGDCTACHTRPGGAPFAGGLSIASPIGLIYSTNITPDPATGIGRYSYGDFERAVRRGLLRSNQTMYPAMPYPSYSRITDRDVMALYAYFMHAVAPVKSRNPVEQVRWPLSARWPLTYWRWLFTPRPAPFVPPRGENSMVARGAYLVEGLAHCGACHTPRALTMQEVALTAADGPRYLAGSQFNGWFAPSLRGEALTGLGRWAGADIEEFLASGRTGKFTAFGEMSEVILHSTQFMTPADRAAIASFLHTLPPPHQAKSATLGARLYGDNCAACHQDDGGGMAVGFPALAANPVVNTDDPTSLIHIVLGGDAGMGGSPGKPKLAMPGFADSLRDEDVANLLNYIRSAWGNHATPVSADQVKAVRATIGKAEPASAASPPTATAK